MSLKTEKQNIQQLTDTALYLQEANMRLAAQSNQLSRILWMTVQAAGGQLTLDESTIPPLWKLEKHRDEQKRLVLTAVTMAMPAEEKIAALVATLEGTANEIMPELLKEIGLDDYPSAWLTHFISNRVVRLPEGRWVPTALAKEIPKQTENN